LYCELPGGLQEFRAFYGFDAEMGAEAGLIFSHRMDSASLKHSRAGTHAGPSKVQEAAQVNHRQPLIRARLSTGVTSKDRKRFNLAKKNDFLLDSGY